MPRKSIAFVPQLRFHKASKQAYVLIDGHFVYLGRADDPEVQNRYDQTIAEWLARGRQLATHQNVIIADVVAAYWQHAVTYYVRPDGTPSGGLDRVRNALKVLRDMYGPMPAAEFGPLKLRALREKWQSSDRKRARRTVNGYVAEVKHMFKWAVSHELVPPSVFHGLTTVQGLRAGRSAARGNRARKAGSGSACDGSSPPHLAPGRCNDRSPAADGGAFRGNSTSPPHRFMTQVIL